MAHFLLRPELTYHRASEFALLDSKRRSAVKANRAFMEGDHWQESEGWIGPPIDVGDQTVNTESISKLRRAFTSKNVISEIVNRQVAGLLAESPQWSILLKRPLKKVLRQIPDPAFRHDPANPDLLPEMIDDPSGILVDEEISNDEKELIQQAENALNLIFGSQSPNDNHPYHFLEEVFKKRLWGYRCAAKLIVKNTGGFQNGISFASLEDAIMALKFIACDPESAAVILDPITNERLGINLVSFTDPFSRQEKKWAEIYFTDDKNRSFVGVLDSLPVDKLEEKAGQTNTLLPDFSSISDPLEIQGNLLIFEIGGNSILISDQIRSQQKALNLALTMGAHTLVENGFNETMITNAELETKDIADPLAEGGIRKVAVPIKRGAGVINNLIGIEQRDSSGALNYATPGIHFKPPTPIDVHSSGKELYYRAILEEVHQLHALIAGDATASGESRKMALKDFQKFSRQFRKEIESIGRWAIETALHWAAVLSGQPGKFESLRVAFNLNVDAGDLSSDELNQLLQAVEKKVVSRKFVRSRIGIQDQDAEESQIKNEKEFFMSAPATDPEEDEKKEKPGE